MAYDVKPGSFFLFKNSKKTNEKQPEYKGSGKTPDGKECWISAWVRKTKNGQEFFSISVQKKEQQDNFNQSQPSDDLPF